MKLCTMYSGYRDYIFMLLKKTFQSLLSKFCSKGKKLQMLNTKHRVTDLKKFNYQFFQFLLSHLDLLLLMLVLSLFSVTVRRPVAEMIWVTF